MTFTYNPLGQVLTTTDRAAKVTANTYNNMGQVATVTDAESRDHFALRSQAESDLQLLEQRDPSPVQELGWAQNVGRQSPGGLRVDKLLPKQQPHGETVTPAKTYADRLSWIALQSLLAAVTFDLGYSPSGLASVNRCGLGGVCLLNKTVLRPLLLRGVVLAIKLSLQRAKPELGATLARASFLMNTNTPTGATAGVAGFNEYGYVSGTRVWKKITRGGSTFEHRLYVHAAPPSAPHPPSATLTAGMTKNPDSSTSE